MPVYVTRAHVTIGDSNKKARHRSLAPKRSFHIGDIFHTPYCIRTFLIACFGLIVVTGGILMTIIGYKPGILLPWYRGENYTYQSNTTEPTSVRNVLGEPGPLRILVYIGPICMGVGFFGMMMSIVLFCEIKDRYLNNIKPKLKPGDDHKEKMYEQIIEEFRKNYFRGIEVPLRKVVSERRKSKHRFSLSLSQSGSIISFGRRLSHDLQRRIRRASKESQPERISENKLKRSALRRIIDPESWMKTSSLPNIRPKDSFVELREIYDTSYRPTLTSKRTSRSCDPTLNIFKVPCDTSGVDNPAFKDSPSDKRRIVSSNEQSSTDNPESNTHVTTVLVHRESNNDDTIADKHGVDVKERGFSIIDPNEYQENLSIFSESDCTINIGDSSESFIDVNNDVSIQFRNNDDTRSIPEQNDNVLDALLAQNEVQKICKCSLGEFCQVHSDCMESGDSSLSLSWDNVPSDWSEARRNTEPVFVFPSSFKQEDDQVLNQELDRSRRKSSVSPSQMRHKEVIKSKSAGDYEHSTFRIGDNQCDAKEKRGPFVRKIGVFKSDTNLLRVGPYSLMKQYQDDSASNDSMDLTDEMLKNFEMVEEAYI